MPFIKSLKRRMQKTDTRGPFSESEIIGIFIRSFHEKMTFFPFILMDTAVIHRTARVRNQHRGQTATVTF